MLSIGLSLTWKLPPAPKGRRRVHWAVYIVRGVLVSVVMFGAVFLGRINEIIAILLAIFPAIMLTAMLSVGLSQGTAVSAGAVGPLILGLIAFSPLSGAPLITIGSAPASVSVATFPMCFPFFLTLISSLWLAAVVTWLICVACVSTPVFLFIRWRERVATYHQHTSIELDTNVVGVHHTRLEEDT